MADPRPTLTVLLLLAVPLAGCIGFGPEGECSAQHAYADRLAFEQEGLYEAMGEAMEAADRGDATRTIHEPGNWTGARGQVEVVRSGGYVHAAYQATTDPAASFQVHDSALTGYGTLWLDRVDWEPEPEAQLAYEAPDDPGSAHELSMTFRDSNLTKDQGADHARQLHATLFPHADYEPLDDPSFSDAWIERYHLSPERPVDANGLVAELVRSGQLHAREAPFPDPIVPHTLGSLHLEGQDAGEMEGSIELVLSHDVRVLAAGVERPLVLEATPDDRAYLSHVGSAPLGGEDLRQLADERFGDIDGLPALALEETSYEEGGEQTGSSADGCSPTRVLGEPLASSDHR